MKRKAKIVVLSGAGISAESGLATFRGSDGLWEGHRVEDVATPEAFRRNPEMVLEFYNQRRRQAIEAQPNAGHLMLKQLEKHFRVVVVTQNVDNLHEKAGSRHIIHLHGELFMARSTRNPSIMVPVEGTELVPGDLGPDGHQLRPHIVWFGEAVPMMDTAIEEVSSADALVVAGTSLQVYPAASLLNYLPGRKPVLYVDPSPARIPNIEVEIFAENASTGMPKVRDRLLELFGLQ
jgi:NAD-dependent deacetylase